jgi:hypothetical protein
MNQECCASPPLAFPPLHLRATCHACAWCSASPAVHAGAGGVRRRDLLPVSPRMPSNVEESGLVDVRVTIGYAADGCKLERARPSESAVIAGCRGHEPRCVGVWTATCQSPPNSITWLLSPGHCHVRSLPVAWPTQCQSARCQWQTPSRCDRPGQATSDSGSPEPGYGCRPGPPGRGPAGRYLSPPHRHRQVTVRCQCQEGHWYRAC